MRKEKIMAARRCLFLGALALFSFSSCMDSDYDFDNVDSTIGFGGDELTLPYLSTEEIPLKDVLELEEDGTVVEDETTHDYVFRQDGDRIDPVHPSVDAVTVSEDEAEDFDLMLMPRGTGLHVDGIANTFTYSGSKPEKVLSLSSAEVDSKIELTIHLTDARNTVSEFGETSVTFPGYMTLDNIATTASYTQSGNTFTFKNLRPSSDLKFTADVTRLTFDGDDLKIDGDNIVMSGRVRVAMSATPLAGVEYALVSTSMRMDDMIINAATGRFNPSIDFDDLGKIAVNGIPDFLDGDNVVIDLYNPMIKLTITSDMALKGYLDGVLKSTKGNTTLATVNVEGVEILPNQTTTVCICRRDEGVTGFDQVIVNENLSDLIKTIPDEITFTADAYADTQNEYRMELGKDYEVDAAYSVDAPIAFAEDARIEYTDVMDGWNDDVKDLDFTDGAYILMTASVENGVPAELTVTANAIDVNGNALSSNDINVAVEGTIAASIDGTTKSTSPLKVTITQKTKGALKKVDGLEFKVAGTSGGVTGITLNAENHKLVVDDITVKLIGKIIADFN